MERCEEHRWERRGLTIFGRGCKLWEEGRKKREKRESGLVKRERKEGGPNRGMEKDPKKERERERERERGKREKKKNRERPTELF